MYIRNKIIQWKHTYEHIHRVEVVTYFGKVTSY